MLATFEKKFFDCFMDGCEDCALRGRVFRRFERGVVGDRRGFQEVIYSWEKGIRKQL